MNTSSGVATNVLPSIIQIVAGFTTVTCLVWCAVNISSLWEMVFWLLLALVSFSVNLFGGGLLSRMITSSIGL
jgi:hypothetical protein